MSHAACRLRRVGPWAMAMSYVLNLQHVYQHVTMRGLKLSGHSRLCSFRKRQLWLKPLASATVFIDIHAHQHYISSPRITVPHHSRSCSISLITNPSPASYKIFDSLTFSGFQRWKAAFLPLPTTLSTLLACSNSLTLFTVHVLWIV